MLFNLKNIKNSFFIAVIISLPFLLISCSAKPEPKPQQPTPQKEKGLVIYKTNNISGYLDKPVIVDHLFIPIMRKIDSFARKYNVELKVTSSFRTPKQQKGLSRTVVKPASRSNHLVGHAIDINIVYKGKWYSSSMIRKKKLNRLPYNVREFINSIRKDKTIRWGGDFSREDPVHLDDHYNKNLNAWNQRYKTCQQAYLNYLKQGKK